MTDWKNDFVQRVRPLSMKQIERTATAALEMFAPSHLQEPGRLDVGHLVDYEFQKFGVHVSPGSYEELQGAGLEGYTDPRGEEIQILISEEQWSDLFDGGARANRPRATVIHELGHAVLHVPMYKELESLRKKKPQLVAARKDRRGDLKPYEDPEWQAWAFAGCFLVPRQTLVRVDGWPRTKIARTYGVSTKLLDYHIRRLRNIPGFSM